MHPLSDDHANEDIKYTYGKPRSSRSKWTRLPHKLGLCNRNPNFRLRIRLHYENVFGFGFSCNYPKLPELGLRLHSPCNCFTRIAIIVQLYITRQHCRFCVMSCFHIFPFVDVSLLSCYILLLTDYIKQYC